MSHGTDITSTGRGGNYQFCLECGAPNFPGATNCFLCGHELKPVRLGIRPPPLPPMHGPMTYSLSTLLLIVTLACVCFGLIVAAPVVGIPLAVLTVPALIRTFEISSELRVRGEKPSVQTFVGNFLSTLASIVLLIVAAAAALFAAFFAICSGMNTGGPTQTEQWAAFGLAVAAVSACFAASRLFKLAAPNRRS